MPPLALAMPLYDLDSCLARLGGDIDLLKKLMQFFLEDCPPLLSRLRAGLRDANAAEVERAAHSLKGLSANFSAEAAVGAALAVEELARAANLSAAAEALPELESQVEKLGAALSAYLEGSSS